MDSSENIALQKNAGIQPELLAAQLELNSFRFPQEYYRSADEAVGRLSREIIPDIIDIDDDLSKMGDYLINNRHILSEIFDFPGVCHLPLLIKRSTFIHHQESFGSKK